jgi:hypothetical protein
LCRGDGGSGQEQQEEGGSFEGSHVHRSILFETECLRLSV